MIVHYPVTAQAVALRIRVDIPVDEWDLSEGELLGCPALNERETRLRFEIDIEAARVADWQADRDWEIHIKARDEGVYTLLGWRDEVLAVRERDYVPKCIPSSYGDYVIMRILPDGSILDEDGDPWPGPTVEQVQDAFWPVPE